MATTSEMRQWLKAHGVEVGEKGALPARLIARYQDAHGEATGPRLLPGPDDDLPPLDFGTVDVDVPPLERETPPAGPPPDSGPAEPGEDEPPGHTRRDWQKIRPRAYKRREAKPPKLTMAQQGDIEAKISFALEIPGRIWQARDPVCGSVFIEQRPEIAAALVEIVKGSPELIAFFAGGGGQFMLALNLMAALWPIVTVIMAHHVYHSIEAAPEAGDQPDYQQYAA